MTTRSVLRTPTTRGSTAEQNGELRAALRLSVRRNFSWVMAAKLVTAACGWGRLVLLAHVASQAAIGQVVLAFAVCNPIAAFADLGLSDSLATDARREFRFGDYLGLRLCTSWLSLAVIVTIALAGGYERHTAVLIVLAGVAATLESIGDIFQAFLQLHERMDFVAVSQMIRGPLGLLLLGAGFLATHSVVWAMAGYSIAAAATLLAVDIPSVIWCLTRQRESLRSLRPLWRAITLGRLAWLSFPLGMAGTTMILALCVPRYMVSYYLGREALADFAIAGSFAVGATLVVGALAQAAGPRLAHYYAAGNMSAFWLLLLKLLVSTAACSGALALAMFVAGRPILRIVYGQRFAHLASLAALLMLASLFKDLTVPLGRAITAMRHFRTNMAIRVFGIFILLALLPILTARLSLRGAALAMLVSWLIAAIVSAITVWRQARKHESMKATAPRMNTDEHGYGPS
jgi:O-antigen/teichoic acid export membrane protein